MNMIMPLLKTLFTWVGTKIMLALGLSIVTYGGFNTSLNLIKNFLITTTNSIPADVYNILMMAGFGQAISIIFGAFAFKAALASVGKLQAGLLNKT